MPNRTQYIRNEDVDAWDALENKSEWIHNHLNQPLPRIMKAEKEGSQKSEENTPSLPHIESKIKEFQGAKKLAFCKNNHAIPEGRDKCMGKGCKYGL